MAKTIAEVRNRALYLLGMLQVGQSPQDADATRVEEAYGEVYADLKDCGLATWTSTGSVPDALVPHVAALVAYECADDYGVSTARLQRVMARSDKAKMKIAELTQPDYESLSQADDF